MINYPQFAKVNDKKYKINTSYKIAIKCDEIARSDVSEEERSLAILYLLFGEEALDNPQDWHELLNIAMKYLRCGKEECDSKEKEANMSYIQDRGYIEASFFSDYNIDLANTDMHYWKFYNLLCGLTEDCVLNRVRFVRDFDISQIKDSKEKQKWIKQKEQVALKKEERVKTSEEKRLDELFEQQLKRGV